MPRKTNAKVNMQCDMECSPQMHRMKLLSAVIMLLVGALFIAGGMGYVNVNWQTIVGFAIVLMGLKKLASKMWCC